MDCAICCIGHLTVDRVITPNSAVTMPGGTAYYFSVALAKLPVPYCLLTSLADSETYIVEALQQRGVLVKVLPSPATLVFENRYGQDIDQRTQRVLQTASPFPATFSLPAAKIFHLGPLLATDFTVDTIKAIASVSQVSLDVQGFLRRVEGEAVVPVDWVAKKEVLPHVYYLKASEEEMAVLTGTADVVKGAKTLQAWGAKEVIITLGSKGSVVYDGRRVYQIPAFAAASVTDATGCGDTYMAGYLYRRSQGAGIQEAGEFAAATATAKIETSGPFTGNKEEVEDIIKSRQRVLPFAQLI